MYMVLHYRRNNQDWVSCGDIARMNAVDAQTLIKKLRALYPNQVYQLVGEITPCAS